MKNLIFTIVLLSGISLGDTFVHRTTGDTFDGFATTLKRGDKTLVRVGSNQSPKYISLTDYNIEWNYAGRRNIVSTVVIDEPIELQSVTDAMVEVLETEQNRGPRFILIELDTPGGSQKQMEDICGAISKMRYCKTVAFIKNGQYGGAYSAGAFVAMACDKIFMAEGTAIGAATTVFSAGGKMIDMKEAHGADFAAKVSSASAGYIAALAERTGKPAALARAMVDAAITPVEIDRDGARMVIDVSTKQKNDKTISTIGTKGLPLTLSAFDAKKYGICDAIVNSRDELLAALGCEGANIVINREVVAVRRAHETISELLEEAASKEELADEIAADVKKIREELSGTESRQYFTERGRRLIVDKEVNSDLEKLYTRRSDDLKSTVNDIDRLYQRAIRLGRRHKSMKDEMDILKRKADALDATYGISQSRR